MNLTQYQKELIELLARHEDALADLYRIYADNFEDYYDFWADLSVEETEHGQWIRALIHKIEEGTTVFQEGRFSKWTIQASIDSIQDKGVAATANHLVIKEALTLSLNIEQAMIENKFFEVFQTDNESLRMVLIALDAGTKKHIERLQKKLEQLT